MGNIIEKKYSDEAIELISDALLKQLPTRQIVTEVARKLPDEFPKERRGNLYSAIWYYRKKMSKKIKTTNSLDCSKAKVVEALEELMVSAIENNELELAKRIITLRKEAINNW